MSDLIFQEVSPLSLSVVPLKTWCGDTLLGEATGFIERGPNGLYVVTNWHNVTGRIPATGKPRAGDGITPDRVHIHLAGEIEGTDGTRGIAINPIHVLEAVVDWGPSSPWVMHKAGQDVDLAASRLPPNPPGGLVVKPISEQLGSETARVRMAAEVYILGYPKGLRPTGILPIWKRGSIAAEPSILPDGEPCFWIDAATREGMSGSPVVVRAFAASQEDRLFGSGYTGPDALLAIDPGLYLLGVYSGRMGVADALEAQLGKVWRRHLISEMLSEPRPLEYQEREPLPPASPRRWIWAPP